MKSFVIQNEILKEKKDLEIKKTDWCQNWMKKITWINI